jgi:hypothetical protein
MVINKLKELKREDKNVIDQYPELNKLLKSKFFEIGIYLMFIL